MDFNLSINLDDDAFQDGRRAEELRRCLAQVAENDAEAFHAVQLVEASG